MKENERVYMFQFIVVLRTVACMLITNSHGEEVYPIRILASGGLLGDVIYFAISGYCLYALKEMKFLPWYGKRLKRVYIPTWITAGLFIVTGIYGTIGAKRVCELLFWPTHYHFVASILVMYIIFFFAMKYINRDEMGGSRRLVRLVLAAAAVFLVLFYTVYDRSYYHIDNVNDHIIWFLYFSSMMIGAYFRMNSSQYLGKTTVLSWIGMFGSGILYIATKLACSRGVIPPVVQWVNQLTLLVLLVFIFRSFIGLEEFMKKVPSSVMAPIRFISSMAFEIYLAQAVIIPTFNTGKETFPHNFLVVMSITFLCAYGVHVVTDMVVQLLDQLLRKKERA